MPSLWVDYQPGLWEQDRITLPIEAGVVALMSASYTRAARPLWPFTNETNPKVRKVSRHPGRLVAASGVLTATATFGTLAYLSEDFAYGPAIRGLFHAHLMTEMATSLAKLSVQRRRPFYDTEKAKGTLRADDTRSFFSGHASHVFAFATYSTRLVYETSHGHWASLAYGLTLHSLAGWVASARAIDGQHHWNDVITGSAVGFLVSNAIFTRTSSVMRAELSPGVTLDDPAHPGFALTLKVPLGN